MDQCAGLTLRQPFERLGGPRFVARQLLVLPHQPSDQGPVVRFAGHARFLPVARLISHARQMTPSLRSPAITAVSTLLRTAPSLGGASLLSASLLRLGPFAWHRRRGSRSSPQEPETGSRRLY